MCFLKNALIYFIVGASHGWPFINLKLNAFNFKFNQFGRAFRSQIARSQISTELPSTPKANATVRKRRRMVQKQRKYTSASPTVPNATT